MRHYLSIVLILVGVGIAAFFARDVLTSVTPVTLRDGVAVPVMGEAGTLRVSLVLENGDAPNRLVSVSSPEAQIARLAGAVSGEVALPAGSTPSLSQDGIYLELTGVEGALDEGRLVPVSFAFEPSGVVTTRVRIGEMADPHAMHKMSNMSQDMANHTGQHDMMPEVTMTVREDATEGWIVILETKHFKFVADAPEPVHVPGEGHGHLYINGLKLQRMYGPEAAIGALPPGSHTVMVTLNNNTHMSYESPDGPVAATAFIEVE